LTLPDPAPIFAEPAGPTGFAIRSLPVTRALALALPLALLGCAPARPAGADLESRLAETVTRFAEAHHLPGLAVGVLRDGQVVYRAGWGTTSLDHGQPVTPATLFHMASISKTIVATAVMQLVMAGQVDLDAPVTRYVPYFRMRDPRAAAITVRQVLTHSAGLPDVTDYRWEHPEYDDGALERYIRGLAGSTLIAAPGERWRYSNIGFELLADLVATVSGQSFEDYVQARILTPAGMRKSTFLMTDVDSTLLAQGHSADSTGRYHANDVYPYNRRHAGSSTLHSNVDDMLRWAAINLGRGSLDGATILPDSGYDRLWHGERDITPDLMARAKESGITFPFSRLAMGLGWFLPERQGHRRAWHSGGDRGFSTDLVLDRSDGSAVVAMTNADGVRLWDLTSALLDTLQVVGGTR
jgi:CubicO group peptidase (beta-lactamase class C family)